ncbi:hypothetical protein CYMTET_48225 [Cymbomonas tetramitiformis]|uniref:Dynamin-type G domain-containing protein n=1 Tax=Cymbomonas tetramitiformis TaxID=36881 RepID=A0AAE0EWY1_9CHLO|nr:hypothetical protein CYMTET_48225 [Cymbomonas tetramitiformis]
MTTLNMFGSKEAAQKQFAAPDHPDCLKALAALYKMKVKPLEETSFFDRFHSSLLAESEFTSNPQVLLIGQYSTGKTTFIKHLIGKDFPGIHIGPEPTTDGFSCIMHANTPNKIPGNVATADETRPFPALKAFGGGFLSKFQVSEVDSEILKHVTLVDTPGVLSGEKQSMGREYDFVQVVKWFAERASLILLLFDANKVDISDEFKKVIMCLQSHDEKVRLVLNKADLMKTDELMHVYGGVMWFLGKVFSTPEVKRSYISSFWDEPLKNPELERFMNAERDKLVTDLKGLPLGNQSRKINEFVRRVRSARVHLLILQHLRKSMPTISISGAAADQHKLLDNLHEEFDKLSKTHEVPKGDFPEVEHYREILKDGYQFNELPHVHNAELALLKEVIDKDIPQLLRHFSKEVSGTEDHSYNSSGERKGWLNFKVVGKNLQHSQEWKKRWIILKDGKFLVYRKTEDLLPKYSYDLENSSAESCPESSLSFHLHVKQVSEILDAKAKAKVKKTDEEMKVNLEMCGEDADDMSHWLHALHVHCCPAADLEMLKKMEEANSALAGGSTSES